MCMNITNNVYNSYVHGNILTVCSRYSEIANCRRCPLWGLDNIKLYRHKRDCLILYSGENKYLKFGHLQKKCVIYNCNGRCILTVRNRISTNKSRNLHFITFMTLLVFDAENKYLNPQANSKNSGSQ